MMNFSTNPMYHLTENEKITLCIFNVLSMALGLLGNIIVVTVLKMDPNSRGMPSMIILRSLAISDILIIVTVQSLYVYSFFYIIDINLARAIHASRWALIFASLLHLLFVSVDRFLAICKPNLYHQKLKHNSTWCFTTLIIIWCFTIVLGTLLTLIPKTTTRVIHRIVGFLCFLATIILILIHIRLFAVARRHCKTMEKEHAVRGYVTPNPTDEDNQDLPEEEQLNLKKHNHFLRRPHVAFFHELRAFRTTSIVCGAFLLSWLPLLIIGLIYVTARDMNDKETMLRIFPYVNTLAFFNAAQNPFIYSVNIHTFRKSLKKIVDCICPVKI